MADAMIKFTPPAPLTHQELLIDFTGLPPNKECAVNVTGPLSQPYWATLKADPIGQAQLFWRTQAAGEYTVSIKNDDLNLSDSFTVSVQPGSLEDQPTEADVKTVEPAEPQLEPKPKPALAPEEKKELQKTTAVKPATTTKPAPKTPARRKPRKSR